MSDSTKVQKHKHTSDTVSAKGKNLRLSFAAWNRLRRLKFQQNFETYSDALAEIFHAYRGTSHLNDDVRSKPPTDDGDAKAFQQSDKTIVVTSEIHQQLLSIKNEYMLDRGYTARGPNAVSVSDILMELITIYEGAQG